MKLGARMLKTGIAIILALYVAELLHIPSPVFAGIAAVFAIQPTIYRSYLTLLEQVQGNIIGAIIASIFVLSFGNHFLIIGFAAIIAIGIMVKLKIENAIRLALVTIIAVMSAPTEDFLQFSVVRSATILLGILSSFAVNLIFLPPKYETKLFQGISDVSEDIIKWMRLSTRFASEDRLLKKELGTIKERIGGINQLYSMYKEEKRYFRKREYSNVRKIVIYRQMIQVNQKSFEILKLQHRYKNILFELPSALQNDTREKLEYLLRYHEQLLQKFMGRVPQEFELFNENIFNREQLMNSFLKEIKNSEVEDEFQPFHLMHILSDIVEYEEQLEHLDRVIRIYQKYHQKKL
ncbi:aromatic acid exporter family protein [Bacillus sp. FJAT-49732]|uniref:Aromatic acid exporter family protein n=1 Tax=Lederbergia citrisecunda TaxID=2833583 RepID=A0A942TI40_9BACI|nr:aromatic acid exporter family protein [Lederbergia citrisecunda]MBS4198450.1 aromatic acid exporter family protein [Lederbergia citrisecunda]